MVTAKLPTKGEKLPTKGVSHQPILQLHIYNSSCHQWHINRSTTTHIVQYGWGKAKTHHNLPSGAGGLSSLYQNDKAYIQNEEMTNFSFQLDNLLQSGTS